MLTPTIWTTGIAHRVRNQHLGLAFMVDELSDEALRIPQSEGKWSAKQLIAHIIAYQPTFISRIRSILTHDTPVFERYHAEQDPLFMNMCELPVSQLLEQMAADREALFKFLTAHDEDDFVREGTHPVYGRMNIFQWVEFFLNHEAYHLFQIQKQCMFLRQQNSDMPLPPL